MPQKIFTDLTTNSIMMNTSLSQQQKVEPVRTKLYVSNFPTNCTRRTLTEFFSKYGQVLECAIMWDKYAFIHYGSMEEAQNALNDARNMYLMGQKLFIQLSISRNRQNYDWYQHEAAKLHQELLTKSKSDINQSMISNSSSSSSNVLVETKLYVTNLPENCNQLELKALFEQYGNVLECVIMWNHYAFIHFADIREAKIALEHLHGYLFNGKNLIVQLSTSSNRPLPKCVVFGQQNNNTNTATTTTTNNNNNKNKKNKKDDTTSNEKIEEKNWIQIIKSGCLPVIKQQSQHQQEETNETKMTQINLNILFNKTNNDNNNSSNDLSLSDHNSKKNTISSSSEIKKNNNKNIDDSEADADTDIELPTVNEPIVVNKKSIKKNNNNNTTYNNSNTSSKKKLSEMVKLDQVPTPPLPNYQTTFIQYNSNSITNIQNTKIQTESNCLKKLIEKINSSVKKDDDVNLDEPETSSILVNEEIFIEENYKIIDEKEEDDDDLKNEKILIEQLNKLKQLQEEEKNSEYFYSPLNYTSSSINNINNKPLRSISCSSNESDEYKQMTSYSSISPATSLASPNSFLTVDFLNSKCVYEENLIKKQQNDTYFNFNNYDQFAKNEEIDNILMNNLLKEQLEMNTKNLLSQMHQQTSKPTKMSRCKVVNYILFPELKEKNYTDKKQYEQDLISLLKQNANIVI